MWRYLAWWLRFEFCNFRRLLGRGSGRVQYFAFGANLSPAIMRQRRIQPLDARYFRLEDYALCFDHPASREDCSYASAAPVAGETLYGVLYTLSERDAARMDCYEMVPVVGRYRRTWVEQDGERLYFYQTNRSTPNLKPTAEYLGFIVDGLALHPDVDDDYRRQLSQTETAEPGGYVDSYLGERPRRGPRWLQSCSSLYRKAATCVFLNLVYRLSLSGHFIRCEDLSPPRVAERKSTG